MSDMPDHHQTVDRAEAEIERLRKVIDEYEALLSRAGDVLAGEIRDDELGETIQDAIERGWKSRVNDEHD